MAEAAPRPARGRGPRRVRAPKEPRVLAVAARVRELRHRHGRPARIPVQGDGPADPAAPRGRDAERDDARVEPSHECVPDRGARDAAPRGGDRAAREGVRVHAEQAPGQREARTEHAREYRHGRAEGREGGNSDPRVPALQRDWQGRAGADEGNRDGRGEGGRREIPDSENRVQIQQRENEGAPRLEHRQRGATAGRMGRKCEDEAVSLAVAPDGEAGC